MADGAALAVGEGGTGAVRRGSRAGFPVTAGTLELAAAGTGSGALVSGRFAGTVDFPATPAVSDAVDRVPG